MKILRYLFIIFLISCSSSVKKEDPLRNSKKLIRGGHKSLYKNGALKVPHTRVKLIAPGPDAIEFGLGLVKINARQSLLMALNDVTSTYDFMKIGVTKSLEGAEIVYKTGADVSKGIHDQTIKDSVYLVKKSAKLPENSIRYSIKLSRKIVKEMRELARRTDEATSKFGEKSRKEFLFSSNVAAVRIKKKTFEVVKELNETSSSIQQDTRTFGDQFNSEMKESAAETYDNYWIGGSRADEAVKKFGSDTDEVLGKLGDETDTGLSKAGSMSDKNMWKGGDWSGEALRNFSRYVSKGTEKQAGDDLAMAKDIFVQGYLTFPEKLKERISSYKEKNLEVFKEGMVFPNEFREKYSKKSAYLISSGIEEVGEDFNTSLEKAEREATEGTSTWGMSLGLLKSLTWLTKALVWDAVIKPVGKLGAGAIGYVSVNGLIYPSIVAVNQGIATTQLAVQIVWDTGKTSFDFIAPTVGAGVASVLSFSEYFGGKAAASGIFLAATPAEWMMKGSGKISHGVLAGTGKASKYTLKGSGKVVHGASHVGGKVVNIASKSLAPVGYAAYRTSGKLVQGGSKLIGGAAKVGLSGASVAGKVMGKVTEKAVQGSLWSMGHMIEVSSKATGKVAASSIRYIGVPLSVVGLPASGAGVGVAVGGAGLATGAAYFASGESAAAGTYLAGGTLSGVTAAAGSIGSVAAGGGLAVYETAKGIAVPASYTLGSGLVLTYGQLTQLGAQTVLAASDAAYLVLSLEGPKWVLYSVGGLVTSGEKYSSGTIVDLEKMQSAGEEIKAIPVSADEVEKVLKSYELY